jgi:superfamily II DNA or RNA helicase
MITVPVKVQGIKATLEDKELKKYFKCESEKYGYNYYGPRKGTYGYTKVVDNIYRDAYSKGFEVGLGALLWLNSYSPDIKFKFEQIEPKRGSLKQEFIIPEKILNAPKFKVNGKERFYFWEALEACKIKPYGTIKLPTGSGKSSIILTLAYNQAKQIGIGMILVPTLAIKKQFLDSAKAWDIDLVDYSEWTTMSKRGKMFITTPHAITAGFKSKKKATLAELAKIDWSCIDEGHHVAAKTWQDILFNLPNCSRIHGFSASPFTSDFTGATSLSNLEAEDAKTLSMLGPIIYEKSASDLKDFLNLPYLINIKFKWENEVGNSKSKKWQEVQKAMINNKERNLFLSSILDLLMELKLKTAMFVNEKDHARTIMNYCTSDKLACWFGGNQVIGKDYISNDTDQLKKGFGCDTLGLILTSHAEEGLDFDNPLNVLLYHEMKSTRKSIQKGGRIVRWDTVASMIINVIDSNCNFLPKHANQRQEDLKEEFCCKVFECDTLSGLLEAIELCQEDFKLNQEKK